MKTSRLGVNIDHVATLRNLRNTPYPSLIEAAEGAIKGGATQITVHLREDRRHIRDEDVFILKTKCKKMKPKILLNLESALTPEMMKIALKLKPDWVCIVPEKRSEVTTEGGLNLKKFFTTLKKEMVKLQKNKIKVSLFIEPSLEAVELSHQLKADAVELHTGRYCIETQKKKINKKNVKKELERIQKSALKAVELGIHAHAGHGFDFENVRPIAALKRPNGDALIEEFNIGHSLICRSVLVGIERATKEMLSAIVAP